jgi:VWFA-related protein
MQVRTRALAGVILLAATSAAAQDPRESQAPVFRAGVELVRLDVRVVDAEGRPVPDVRREELEVLENGRPRPIVLFQRIHAASPANALGEARAVTRDISTNQGAPRGHLYVLVFDQQHISPGNEQRARQAAERFLRTRLRPMDRAALYALPGPGPQLDFTRDVDRLIAELPKIRGDLDRGGIGALGTIAVRDAYEIVRGNELVLRRVAQRLSEDSAGADVPSPVRVGQSGAAVSSDSNIFDMAVKENARSIVAKQDEAGRRFLTMLADVVRSLRGVEGRKALVLFSEGFYADNLSRELEQVAAAAAQSYVMTYTLDLNHRDVSMTDTEPVGGSKGTEIQNRIEPLASLAVETSGVFVPNATSRIDSTLSAIASQSEDYYIVGFEPDPEALKDRSRYRRVTVRTARSGARASTRTGYAINDEPTPADRRRSIDAALRAPFPQQSLPIEYTTYVMKGQTPGTERVLLSVEADLPIAQPGHEAFADVVFVARSVRDGRAVASGTDRMPVPASTSDGRTTGKGQFRVQFDAPPGQYVMRVVVREPGGAVGSADRHFVVRRLGGASVTASDVVLGASATALPVRANAYTGDGLTGVMELYAPAASELETVDVTASLMPIGEAREVISTRADLAEINQAESGASRPARIALPLSNVQPGEYFLRVRVRHRGETIAEMDRDLRVLPGDAPRPAVSGRAAPSGLPRAADAAVSGRAAPSGLPRAADAAGGDVARALLANVTLSSPLSRAASLATEGRWSDVPAALPDGSPSTAEHLALRGLLRLQQESYRGAADDLAAALELQPSNAQIAFLLGWAHTGAGENAKAIGAWRSAAYIEPSLVPAHLALADAYLRVSQPALAAQALRAGLSALPNSPELAAALASLAQRQ